MTCKQQGGATLGIVGGGQLGRMLALAGAPLGVHSRVLEPGENPPAAIVADCLQAEFDEADKATQWARDVDCVTYEFENIPAETLEAIASVVPVRPAPASLRVSCDRVLEKELFGALGITTTRWRAVANYQDLEKAVLELGLPLVLKTRRFGYDGKGQAIARDPSSLENAWTSLGEAAGAVGLLAEEMIPFTGEVSQVSVRGRDGDIRHYPLTRNVHRDGILRFSAPIIGGAHQHLVNQARAAMELLMNRLDHVGVLTIEFFVHKGGLIANEIAPRVHNSGHWTQNGSVTCQFENHVRAVLGWPLGDTALLGYPCMVNLVGFLPPVSQVLAVAGAHAHFYGKDVKPGRKVGHINLCLPGEEQMIRALQTVAKLIPNESSQNWLKQINLV